MKVLKLREYRESLKMSQRQVAEAINTPQSNYWKWEKGISVPDANQIVLLCSLFECTPNDLFGFKGLHKVVITELKKID